MMNYTIVKPQNLDAAYAANGKLPVILFGNGGCSRNPRLWSIYRRNVWRSRK